MIQALDDEPLTSDKKSSLFIDIKKTKMRKQSSSGDDSTPIASGTPGISTPSVFGIPLISTPSVDGTPVSGASSVVETPVAENYLIDYPANSNLSQPNFQVGETLVEVDVESKPSIEENKDSNFSTLPNQCDKDTKIPRMDSDLSINFSTKTDVESTIKQGNAEKVYDFSKGMSKAEWSPGKDCVTVRELLEFWLVMRFSDSHDALDIYFHRR